MHIFLGEVIGTMFLILLGDGVVANVLLSKSKGQNSGWIVIATAWAMAVFVGVYTSVAVGGNAHLNPAVTIGLAVSGAVPWGDVPVYIVGEFIGAALGAILVWLAYLPHWPGDPKYDCQPGVRDHRYVCTDVRRLFDQGCTDGERRRD